MEEMKEINMDAYKWLEELAPNTWVRTLHSDFLKCDMLLNNNCEVLNIRKNQVAEKRAENLEAKKIGDGQKNSLATAKKKRTHSCQEGN
jgi:hypothetical protein